MKTSFTATVPITFTVEGEFCHYECPFFDTEFGGCNIFTPGEWRDYTENGKIKRHKKCLSLEKKELK